MVPGPCSPKLLLWWSFVTLRRQENLSDSSRKAWPYTKEVRKVCENLVISWYLGYHDDYPPRTQLYFRIVKKDDPEGLYYYDLQYCGSKDRDDSDSKISDIHKNFSCCDNRKPLCNHFRIPSKHWIRVKDKLAEFVVNPTFE
eukprot:GHVP01069314.1.p1 GENE.GHVP01069314.1~~GHVP01069314.1.p1  ORF type:complete len:142 (-),score=15.71 GHVP01069314.1:131-556(-)